MRFIETEEMTMKKRYLLLVVLLLSGCAHVTAERPAPSRTELSLTTVTRSIVKGKTTGKELIALFGPPNSVVKNDRLPTPEMLAKAKGPLPPIARTVEFWNYWTTPPEPELQRSTDTGSPVDVFRVLVFLDRQGVVVDYTAANARVTLAQ
jgi:hypothetical protein